MVRDPQKTLDNFDFTFSKKMNCRLVFDLAANAEELLEVVMQRHERATTMLTTNLWRTGASCWGIVRGSPPCWTASCTTVMPLNADRGAGERKQACLNRRKRRTTTWSRPTSVSRFCPDHRWPVFR